MNYQTRHLKNPVFIEIRKNNPPTTSHIRSRIIKTNQINRNINRNIIVFEVPLLFEKNYKIILI